jgi:hypothetical protein
MLDNVGSATTFRCGGCGRALKVPAQFRTAPEGRATGPGSRPESPIERTQALPKVAPAQAPIPAATPAATAAAADGDRVGGAGGVVGAAPPAARPPAAAPGAVPGGPASRPAPPLHPPLILRFAVWVIALPLGSFLVFILASWSGFLTRTQLENTILLPGWGRFVPIARLLPFCALATALLVQLGIFGLERLRDRNLRRGPPGRRRPSGGGGPRRPMTPQGQGQGATNGSRSRDRVIS